MALTYDYYIGDTSGTNYATVSPTITTIMWETCDYVEPEPPLKKLKNWRWYHVFDFWVEPTYPKQKPRFTAILRRVQEKFNIVQRCREKRRRRMQKLLTA